MKKQLLLAFLVINGFKSASQCVSDPTNIYSFTVNAIPYEIVKENKSWVDAAACAVLSGGKLTEINSKAEQDTIFYYLNQAAINVANTVAPDGGGASYVWIGGNDLAAEGNWRWDGDNSGVSTPFWQGTSSGSSIGGLYSNWGNEPDNWNGQDGLGLAVTNWPLGLAGQWNDVDETNALYYVIEYPEILNTTFLEEQDKNQISFFPNPANNEITFTNIQGADYTIINMNGAAVLKGKLVIGQTKIILTDLPKGIYTLVLLKKGTYRFVKD